LGYILGDSFPEPIWSPWRSLAAKSCLGKKVFPPLTSVHFFRFENFFASTNTCFMRYFTRMGVCGTGAANAESKKVRFRENGTKGILYILVEE
jgi:hypothetical protein